MNEIQIFLSKSDASLAMAQGERDPSEATRHAALSTAYSCRAMALMQYYPSSFNEHPGEPSND